ncbi:NAD-dependent epimerase/dehydratase family protein [Desulfovibrio sp. TomC]|uniref:NAD-dependent epimerase/dehydratase family protein n=1 Tax=Desulfovibrio sp. TomC TaxID=1562888 RepID=UPI00057595EB|nr:NAD-dependent epimerase/dehydratase family protein [Desulfovibrio sp. TomC]KHK00643.1 Oxidoreductase [Desulfovibrio sp. TomC]
MNIFATGASGGLGTVLLPALAAAGHTVTALARNPRALPAVPGLQAVQGDLLNPLSYADALPGHDAVLHLAALTHAPNAGLYQRANVAATADLLAACATHCREARFVLVSTRAIGQACGDYGQSKAQAEQLVRASGLPAVILRPAEVYGVGRGEAVAALARRCARGGILPLPGQGAHVLTPVHIDDLIPAFLAALTRPAALGHTYTLAGDPIAFAALAGAIAAHHGKTLIKIPIPLRLISLAAWLAGRMLKNPPLVPDQVARLTCPKDADSTAARTDLDFSPRPLDIAAMLAD